MQVFQVQSYFKAAAITNAAMAMAYLSTPYQSPNPTKYRLESRKISVRKSQ